MPAYNVFIMLMFNSSSYDEITWYERVRGRCVMPYEYYMQGYQVLGKIVVSTLPVSVVIEYWITILNMCSDSRHDQ